MKTDSLPVVPCCYGTIYSRSLCTCQKGQSKPSEEKRLKRLEAEVERLRALLTKPVVVHSDSLTAAR